MTVTSAMKGLKATVNTLLTAIVGGKWDEYAGKISNLGLVSGDDTSLNYVGLPEETTLWNDTFKKEDYLKLVADMANGTIKVSNDTNAEKPSAENIKINYQGNIK